MKVALVHDYLSEFGGAERVLLALTEIYPKAPIYTAFMRKRSAAGERFKDRKVKTSWVQKVPGFSKLWYSPLRFLAPKIWNSFDFSKFDVVIGSSSWYVTKGFKGKGKAMEVCYCHTPPRWLYGYRTSVEWQRYWPVRVYGQIIGHFMRQYDFRAAQRVDYFIANSKEVKKRISKFYRRDSKVIYPPVFVPIHSGSSHLARNSRDDKLALKSLASLPNYYLTASRVVGGKGLELAVKAAVKMGFKLKVVGESAGYGREMARLKKLANEKVEFVGRVEDAELARLYAGAKAFLAMAEMEDFGITPVEAMLAGTPVVAFAGGGYLESVVEGKTGVFFKEYSVKGLGKAIKRLEKIKIKSEDCKKQAKKFSKERFKREIKEFVEEKIRQA